MRLPWALFVPLFALACGARSDLSGPVAQSSGAGSGGDAGSAGAGVGGAGGAGGQPCKLEGAVCSSDGECCAGQCQMGACASPPPPCAADDGPVQLVTGLSDPYSLGADATHLYIGQLETDRPLLRLPKIGGDPEVLVDHESFVEYIVVEGGTVFYSDEHSLRSVPAAGGAPSTLASASGPAGFALTSDRVFLADYFGKELLEIDRATLATTVLGSGYEGIYRVAARPQDVYFSTAGDGLHHMHLPDKKLSLIGSGLGGARAVRVFGDSVYYTVPQVPIVYRLGPGSDSPEAIVDLSKLGVFAEALESDGQSLYTTLVTGQGPPGMIARAPLAGGEPEVVVKNGGGTQPSALVVDDACVYWTERDTGSVFRARKAP